MGSNPRSATTDSPDLALLRVVFRLARPKNGSFFGHFWGSSKMVILTPKWPKIGHFGGEMVLIIFDIFVKNASTWRRF